MENIKPEHQEFFDENPRAVAVLEAFRAIRERHGGRLQFWDLIDLTVEDAESRPAVTIDLTNPVRDPSLDDQQALSLEAETQTALSEITQRRIDEAVPRTVSLDRLDEVDDVDEYLHALESIDESNVPVSFAGQAEQLLDPASRATFFKKAGATAFVETLRTEMTGDVQQRVELHNLGDN